MAWLIPVAVCLGIVIVPVIALSAYWLYRNKGVRNGKPAPDAVHLMENGGTNGMQGSYTLEHLKLSTIVGE